MTTLSEILARGSTQDSSIDRRQRLAESLLASGRGAGNPLVAALAGFVGGYQQQTALEDQETEESKLQKQAAEQAQKPQGLFEGNAMDAQVYNILSTKDPTSREYKIAYDIAATPKVQVDAAGNRTVVKPNLSAFLRPGASPTPQPAAQLPGSPVATNIDGTEILQLPSESGQLKTQMDAEGKLRDDYNSQSKPFITQKDAYGRIKQSVKDPSPAGDLSLVFGYMRLLDPGSTVREGEFANAENAAGIPERIRQQYNKAISGEKLTPEQRADFEGRSDKLYKGAETQQKGLMKTYSKLANQYKVKPENVAIDYSYIPESAPETPVGARLPFDAMDPAPNLPLTDPDKPTRPKLTREQAMAELKRRGKL